MKLTNTDKCYILAALERCQDAPESTLERAAAVLGRDAPWAPFPSLSGWLQAHFGR